MPTYNERQNLEPVAGRVRAALPEADLLVRLASPVLDCAATYP